MVPMRSSRFGQFADPNFGASLSHSNASDPGVLPEPGASPSASAMPETSNALGTLGPGLMGQSGHNPGTVYLAGGGMIPDETQDSGNAMPAGGDPFGIIQQALSFGRKKMGLPESFFGDKINRPPKEKPTNDAAETNQSALDEGSNGQLQDNDVRAFQNNQIMNNLQPGENGEWGNVTLEGKEKTANLAEGGPIEEDTGTEQGVIPDGSEDQSQDQGQDGVTPNGGRGDPMGQGGYPDVFQGKGQQQGGGQQNAMAYLTGQGGVSPEIAASLERQVDPQGQMPASLRKMLAVAQAGSPDKAFQVLQHYRQKFNALNAFAKAAAQGGGGRPPDLKASTDAATQAYQHLPDGNDMTFMPVQGGVRVAVNKVIPSKPAPSGGEDNSQGATQMFEEGGVVEDDQPEQPDMAEYTTAGKDDQNVMAGYGEKQQAPHEMLRDFVLSIPQYLGWLSKDGQADSVMDKGVETTLSAASQQGQVPGPGAPQGPEQDQGVTSQRPQDPAVAAMNANPMTGGQDPGHQPTPPDAKQFGAKVGTEGGREGATLQDVLHEIDQAYPSVGMSRERALARAAARQHWADNYAKIDAEQTKSARAENVAKIGAGAKQGVADTQAAGRVTAVGMQVKGAGDRNANTVAGKAAVADKTIAAQGQRLEFRENQLNARNDTTQKPSLVGNKEKIDAAAKARGPARMAPQPGVQAPPDGEQIKLVKGKWYKRGPNGEAIEVAGPAGQ